MKIALITPAKPGTRNGNRNTAVRWAGQLKTLGHRVRIMTEWDGKPVDAMLALHARRSAASISRFASAHPERALVVALTGTDLYRDIQFDAEAIASLALADSLIVLQPLGARSVPPEHRPKVCVVIQSAPRVARGTPLKRHVEFVVSGHLREEKDPFRAAAATLYLPLESRIVVNQIGGAMSPEFEQRALEWQARSARYHWRGELAHGAAMRLLARAHAMIISSRMEGGANVVSEAIACGVPVLASTIDGNVGLLGSGYAGYFPLADERALARLMLRCEREPAFIAELAGQIGALAPLVTPEAESNSLAAALAKARARKGE